MGFLMTSTHSLVRSRHHSRFLRWLAPALFGVSALATLAPPASSQEPTDTFRLDELVVTATGLPAARRAVPAAVTVLRGNALRALGLHRVADALRLVPGAHLVSSGPTGSLTSLFLRGGESDYVQVLIDGVTVNEPGGSFDFAHLSTLEVERIEVVRGPVSVLYGTDAVAGVVQIFTRTGTGAPVVRATAEAGSFDKVGVTPAGGPATGGGNSLNLDVGVSGATSSLGYSFGVSHNANDGVLAVNNDYEKLAASGALRWSAPWAGQAPAPGIARTQAALTARFSDHTYHYPTDGAGRLVDLNQHGTGRSVVLGVEAGHSFTERLETRAALDVFRGETGTEDTPDSPADTLGSYASTNDGRTRRTGLDVLGNVRFQQAVLTVGVAGEWQSGSSTFSSQSQFGPFESDASYERSSKAVYTQLVARPIERVDATIGGRYQHSETFGGFTTYRAGVNLRATSSTTVRASLGTGFKEPTFFENFARGFTVGNTKLEPERSRSAELGLVQGVGAGFLTVTLFDQRFHDLIQYDGRPRAQRPDSMNYYNLAEASSRGIEVELSARPHERVDLTGGWTVLDTEVLDAGLGADRAFTAGDELLRRPSQSGSLRAGVQATSRVRASLGWRWVGERDDLDFRTDFQGTRVVLPSHSLVDAGVEVDVVRVSTLGPVALTARVLNALDESYQEVFGFPAPGRAFYLGIRTGTGG
jgi:vitamin B12 transporter